MPAYQLTSAWQKIASSGDAVLVQNLALGSAIIATSSGGPPSDLDGIVLTVERPTRRYALTADLYARANAENVTLSVITGFSLPSSSGIQS